MSKKLSYHKTWRYIYIGVLLISLIFWIVYLPIAMTLGIVKVVPQQSTDITMAILTTLTALFLARTYEKKNNIDSKDFYEDSYSNSAIGDD